ncbi:VOC family protein [Polaribacter butkevichii]|uniref:Glyoxalase n=1 Tax=Polaribacter butkevichii TaxID=218490 RepID=A0A2P6C7P1_9FLAO|nr:VOC family protein [Polaribacter butkevichii]PQJ68936.1 glyoxalase [Polaribacter butkevichii]
MSFFINHIALSVKDVNDSVAFYQRVFQLKEIENKASNSNTRWLSLNEGKQLHLIPRPNFEIKTNKAVHFALSTSDFDLFVKKIENLNIEYTDWHDVPNEIFIRKDGKKQIYFQDPNGYWIEVNNDV